MVSFYAGFFSWWTRDNSDINFTGTLFKKIFEPPQVEQVETLTEKSCLSYFVDNVLLQFFE